MKRKQWGILLVAVMASAFIITGCGNKAEAGSTADDGVSVMANAATDGETQDSEPTGEASLDFPTQVQSIENNTPALPKAFREMMEANSNRVQVAIETAKATNEAILKAEAERKEAQARAEAERKEAERKEAEARAAEEKAQAEAAAQPAPESSASDENIKQLDRETIYLDYDLLPLVNADRANNGVAELQWSDSLAQYCKDRIPVIEYNIYNGVWVHEGYTKRENEMHMALFTSEMYCNTEMVNQDWIESEGHHSARIDSDYTMYAAAAYQNSEGLVIWIEAFE